MFDGELPAVLQKISDTNEAIESLNLIKKLRTNPIENIDSIIDSLNSKKELYIKEYNEMMNDMVLESEAIMEGLEILYE